MKRTLIEKRRQVTEEELSNPLHRVKLKENLEDLLGDYLQELIK